MSKNPAPAPNVDSIIERHKRVIENRLRSLADRREPRSVYAPIQYILEAGGKRLRAVLTILACEAVGGKSRSALDAAVAIELLHNFTLVHDDIMDNADLRRGRPTVHKRWDANAAILSGDQLAAAAYEELLRAKSSRMVEIAGVFTRAFATVCEGQGFDMEFELRNDVSVADYLMMIDKKTAAVIAAATEIGALAGGGTPARVRSLRTYGYHLGRAFQLQDDVLDIDGNEAEFGKRIGTDILEGKRTFLLLTARERTRGRERALIGRILDPGKHGPIGSEVIPVVRELYRRHGIIDDAYALIARETGKAQRALATLSENPARAALDRLADQLRSRRT